MGTLHEKLCIFMVIEGVILTTHLHLPTKLRTSRATLSERRDWFLWFKSSHGMCKRTGWKVLLPLSYCLLEKRKLYKAGSTQPRDISPLTYVTTNLQPSVTPVHRKSQWKAVRTNGSIGVQLLISEGRKKLHHLISIAICRQCIGINVLM